MALRTRLAAGVPFVGDGFGCALATLKLNAQFTHCHFSCTKEFFARGDTRARVS